MLQIKVNELLWKWLDVTFLLIHLYPSLHILLSLSNCTVEGRWYHGIGRDRHTSLKYTQKHTLPKTIFPVNINDTFSSSLFSIDHLALSSINLQNALFKLLINTLIDLQKCHSVAKAVDGHKPTAVQLPTVTNDEYPNEWVHYSLPGKGNFGLLG